MYRIALAVSAVLAIAAPSVAAERPSQLIVFGDSLVDAGNLAALVGSDQFSPRSEGYYKNRFTNGPDFTDLLNANFFGRYQGAAYAGQGTNYAVGGARVVDTGDFVPDLAAQLGFYLGTRTVDSNALYVLNFGGNDVFGLQSGNIGSFTPETYAAALVGTVTGAVQQLSSLGASRILVMGIPNTTPVGFGLEGQLQAGLDAIEPGLGNTTLLRYSYLSFFTRVAADPAAYGIPPFTEAGECFDVREPVGGKVDCSGFTTVDGTHPTAQIQAALYRDVLSEIGLAAVPEPASWAMMITGFGMAGVAMRRRVRHAA